jgi:hypothetical protein
MRDPQELLAILVLTAVTAIAGTAMAEKKVPFQTPAQLKAECDRAGGLYGGPNAHGVYACAFGSGQVIACGGLGGYDHTCGTGDDNPVRGVNPALGPGEPAPTHLVRQ